MGELLEGDLYMYGGTRDFGTFERGPRAEVRHVRVVRIDLDNADPSTAYGLPFVVVEACRDATKVKLVNVDDKHPLMPYVPLRTRQRYTVALTEDGWRIADRRDLAPNRRCPA